MTDERTDERPTPEYGTMTPQRSDCGSVSDALAAVAGGDRAFRPPEIDHLGSCLRCRVEEARYRRLMEAMRSLRTVPTEKDSRLESQILGHLDLHGNRWDRHARSRVAATVGGLAAGAAATAGLIALTARHRRAARLAS